MYRSIFAILLLFGTSTKTHAQVSILGSATNPDNGHLYHILTTSTWTDAEAFAITLGGHLVTINNDAENTWVSNTFSQFGGTNRSVWLGFNDAATEGTFVWSSGEAVTYTNWALGEPNNGGGIEDYAYINPPGNPFPNAFPTWNDFFNVSSNYGVVEIASVPESSSLTFGGIVGIVTIMTYWYRVRSQKRLNE